MGDGRRKVPNELRKSVRGWVYDGGIVDNFVWDGGTTCRVGANYSLRQRSRHVVRIDCKFDVKHGWILSICDLDWSNCAESSQETSQRIWILARLESGFGAFICIETISSPDFRRESKNITNLLFAQNWSVNKLSGSLLEALHEQKHEQESKRSA